MSSLLTAQLFALLTAFGYATSSAAVRFGMRTSSPLTAILTLVCVTLLSFGPAAVATVRSHELEIRGLLILAAAGVAAPGLAGTFHYMGIRTIGLSRSTSIVGSSPLVAVLIGVAALGERPKPLSYLGTLLIVTGIVLLSQGRRAPSQDDKGGLSFWRGFSFAAIAALMFGVAGILRKVGISVVPFLSVALCSAAIGALITIVLWLPFLSEEDRIHYGRENIGFFIAGSTINMLSHVTFFTALRMAPIYAVVPLAYTTPLWALGYSWVLFKDVEQANARLAAGAVLIVFGAAVVTVSLA